jgi:hypothetical protein
MPCGLARIMADSVHFCMSARRKRAADRAGVPQLTVQRVWD